VFARGTINLQAIRAGSGTTFIVDSPQGCNTGELQMFHGHLRPFLLQLLSNTIISARVRCISFTQQRIDGHFTQMHVGFFVFAGRSSGGIKPGARRFIEDRIQPILVDACYECHSTETGKHKGGLTLDSKVGLLRGGNSGAGVVPHTLEDSMIWLAVSWSDPDLEMPPEKKLSPAVIADFKTWIEMGAPDPRDAGSTPRSWSGAKSTSRPRWFHAASSRSCHTIDHPLPRIAADVRFARPHPFFARA
jgi:hypothetical protein